MTTAALSDSTDVREQLRRWVNRAWDPDVSLLDWRRMLFDAGWACPTWPREWGGQGLSASVAEIVAVGLAELGCPGPPKVSARTWRRRLFSSTDPIVSSHGSFARSRLGSRFGASCLASPVPGRTWPG